MLGIKFKLRNNGNLFKTKQKYCIIDFIKIMSDKNETCKNLHIYHKHQKQYRASSIRHIIRAIILKT